MDHFPVRQYEALCKWRVRDGFFAFRPERPNRKGKVLRFFIASRNNDQLREGGKFKTSMPCIEQHKVAEPQAEKYIRTRPVKPVVILNEGIIGKRRSISFAFKVIDRKVRQIFHRRKQHGMAKLKRQYFIFIFVRGHGTRHQFGAYAAHGLTDFKRQSQVSDMQPQITITSRSGLANFAPIAAGIE